MPPTLFLTGPLTRYFKNIWAYFDAAWTIAKAWNDQLWGSGGQVSRSQEPEVRFRGLPGGDIVLNPLGSSRFSCHNDTKFCSSHLVSVPFLQACSSVTTTPMWKHPRHLPSFPPGPKICLSYISAEITCSRTHRKIWPAVIFRHCRFNEGDNNQFS